jgi:hypothetical protein
MLPRRSHDISRLEAFSDAVFEVRTQQKRKAFEAQLAPEPGAAAALT